MYSADFRLDNTSIGVGKGFDVKAMRAIVRLRKMDKADYQEQEYMIDLYKHALGMLEENAPAEDDMPPEGDAF